MVADWLRRTSGEIGRWYAEVSGKSASTGGGNRHEPLDLRRHGPDQFQGKFVNIRRREYRIGTIHRVGDEGYAHRLVNALSGICLHLVQIRAEYADDPESALRASRAKEAMTARLRRVEKELTAMSVHEGHGGSFELFELGWVMFDSEGEPSVIDDIREADRLNGAGDLSGAVRRLENVLDRFPHHTEALVRRAALLSRRGRYDDMAIAIARAVEVEPNFSPYRGLQVRLTVESPRFHAAASQFDELRSGFPLIPDFDLIGINAYLHAGRPRDALALFGQGGLPEEGMAQVATSLKEAVRQREAFEDMDNRLRASWAVEDAEDSLLASLEAMHAASPVDPDIMAALGFRLRAASRHEQAANLLMAAARGIDDRWVPACWVNAGYCHLAAEHWAQGMFLLDAAMHAISTGRLSVAVADVPGFVDWLHLDGTVRESATVFAADCLADALMRCPDKALVTPAVEVMARLLSESREQKLEARLRRG